MGIKVYFPSNNPPANSHAKLPFPILHVAKHAVGRLRRPANRASQIDASYVNPVKTSCSAPLRQPVKTAHPNLPRDPRLYLSMPVHEARSHGSRSTEPYPQNTSTPPGHRPTVCGASCPLDLPTASCSVCGREELLGGRSCAEE